MIQAIELESYWVYYVDCDGCRVPYQFGHNAEMGRLWAAGSSYRVETMSVLPYLPAQVRDQGRLRGWKSEGDQDYCPRCQELGDPEPEPAACGARIYRLED